MNAMKQAVIAREVPFLVHFTRTKNLRSILEHGIVPREQVDGEALVSSVNDDLRLDKQLGANCLSVGFPNAKMFYKLRQENPGANWVILVVSRTILWEMPCACCPINAASASITSQPIANFRTPAAFDAMYDPSVAVDRGKEKLQTYDPTDVQAEVLAFGTIEPRHILGAIFQRKPIRDQYLADLGKRRNWVHGTGGFFPSAGTIGEASLADGETSYLCTAP